MNGDIKKSIIDKITAALNAINEAQEIADKSAAAGFDTTAMQTSIDTRRREVQRLKQAFGV